MPEVMLIRIRAVTKCQFEPADVCKVIADFLLQFRQLFFQLLFLSALSGRSGKDAAVCGQLTGMSVKTLPVRRYTAGNIKTADGYRIQLTGSSLLIRLLIHIAGVRSTSHPQLIQCAIPRLWSAAVCWFYSGSASQGLQLF